MNRILIALIICLITHKTHAERIVIWNAPIHLIASSKTEYQAHVIESSIGIKDSASHPTCGNGMYIPFAEKELFSVALTAKVLKRSVNIIYEDNAEPKDVLNRLGLTCKAINIWLSSEPGE